MKRLIATLLCVLALDLAGCAPGEQGATSVAELIFTNGKIVTFNDASTVASGLAVGGDRILAVGSDSEALAHRGGSSRVVDLEGKTVIPGLQDSHIHFLGLGRDISERADLTFARTGEEILEAVQDLKRRLDPEPGEWLLGSRWDQHKYPRMVTRWQLDEIVPDNPVRLSRVYRGVLVNTAVFRLMGIQDDQSSTWPEWWLEDPPDFTFEDAILREKRTITVDGSPRELEIPNGVFLGRNGARLVTARPPRPDFEADVESVRLGVEEMLRLGVTSIVDGDSRGDYNMRVYQEAKKRGHLLLRVPGVYFGSFYQQPPDEIRKLLQSVDMNEPSNDFLRWRGTKFYSDGGAGTRSAWVSEPFANWQELEGTENHGYPFVEDDELREEQFRAALEYGWDLHTHSCGDLAMRQTVSVYMNLMDEIRQERPNADLRWSVIHAYLPMEPGTSVLEDMARYGVIAAPNPVFNWQQGSGFASNLGADRMARLQPFRSYIQSGVIMASGSDYPITSHDPWIGIYALLTRRDQASGQVYGPDETLGIMDALRSYTTHGAYLTYDDETRGTLEAGKLADLVVLDLADIRDLEREPELCFGMSDRVVMTLVGGKIRYQKEEVDS